MKNIKYIFFGSPEFAQTILFALIDAGLPPIAVVTNPDRPFGRKKVLTPPPAKLLAEKYNIPVFQPEKIGEECVEEMKTLEAETFVVAAYAKIIPKMLIDAVPLGALGIHPSLLPHYRGASPIQGAILGGEKETGVAIYKMDEAVDHGPVFAERKTEIGENETYVELQKRLANIASEMIVEILPKFANGEITPVEQKHEEATLTKKFKTEDGFVSEEILAKALSGENAEEAERVSRIIRALNPDPGVWTLRQAQGKPQRIKLLSAKLENGRLKLEQVQMEGKTPQPAKLYF